MGCVWCVCPTLCVPSSIPRRNHSSKFLNHSSVIIEYVEQHIWVVPMYGFLSIYVCVIYVSILRSDVFRLLFLSLSVMAIKCVSFRVLVVWCVWFGGFWLGDMGGGWPYGFYIAWRGAGAQGFTAVVVLGYQTDKIHRLQHTVRIMCASVWERGAYVCMKLPRKYASSNKLIKHTI